jgi:hypothetical protein
MLTRREKMYLLLMLAMWWLGDTICYFEVI